MGPRLVRAAWAAGCLAAAAGAVIAAPTDSNRAPLSPPQIDHALADAAAPAAHGPSCGCTNGAVIDRLLRVSDEHAADEGIPASDRRGRLLARIASGHACFVNNPTPAQLEKISRLYGGRNPAEKTPGLANRFFLDTSAWDRNGQSVTQVVGRGVRIDQLTFSFPADNTEWIRINPTTDMFEPWPNELNARLEARFGVTGRDLGREYFRQVFAAWQYNCGVKYVESCDDNAPIDFVPAPTSPLNGFRGDIRIGATPQGRESGTLAFNYFPEGGGDMVLNSTYFDFNGTEYNSASNGFRFLRNAAAHEHGHGLGFRHAIPCSQTKLMEPFSSTVYDTIQIDEKRGAQHNYGDRYAGNHHWSTARELNERHLFVPTQDPPLPPLPPPSDPRFPSTGSNFKQGYPLDRNQPLMGLQPHSAIERDLSTNGAIGAVVGPDPFTVANPTGQDWFTFTIENQQVVFVRVTQFGGSYQNGPQSSDPNSPSPCSGTAGPIDADRAGNLAVEVYATDASGAPVLNAMGNPLLRGELEPAPSVNNVFTTPDGLLPAGKYLVRVFDRGPNPIPAQPTQLYNLEVRLGLQGDPGTQLPVPPLAVAGVDKIARMDQFTQYIGDINSRVQQAGLQPLVTANYEWDLDGDGVFEININDFIIPPPPLPPPNPQINPRTPFITYTGANRVIPVSLRVTDQNGLVATDTIFVRVIGEPVTITGVMPAAGNQGDTLTNVTITGTGLGAITSASQIAVSGAGVTVTGIPSANTAGTTLTGLSFVIDSVAVPGVRDIIFTDGCSAPQTAAGLFTVNQFVPPPPNDECLAPATWPAGIGCKDADNRGGTTASPQDYAGTACDGQTIFHDVWYLWQAPAAPAPGFAGLIPVRVSIPDSNPAFGVRVAAYRLTGPLTCPPAPGDLLGCIGVPPQSSTFDINVAPGETILFRFGSINQSQTGIHQVCMAITAPLGACCVPGQACTVRYQPSCSGSGVTFNSGGTCAADPCTYRCCFPNGLCQVITPAQCAAGNGLTDVTSSTCSPACPQPTAQCCLPNADCVIVTAGACAAAGGDFNPASTSCSPNPCAPLVRVCCLPDGSCTVLNPADCSAASGTLDAAQSACPPVNTCPQPAGRCCLASGECRTVTEAECTALGGAFTAGQTVCSPNPCPQPQRVCCLPNGNCQVLDAAGCSAMNGVYNDALTACPIPNSCPQPTGACCSNGLCTLATSADCSSSAGTWQGAGVACTPDPCPPPTGACCNNGLCTVTTLANCTGGGTWRGIGTSCTPNDCPQPIGACCTTATGACAETTAANCATLGLVWTANTACSPIVCRFVGACCNGTSCSITFDNTCMNGGGLFQGQGTACGPVGNPTTCCRANINRIDGVTVQDVFEFLQFYFLGDPRADFDTSGFITVNDIIAFLQAYFAGCGGGGVGACCTGSLCTATDAGACTGTFLGAGQVCEGDAANPITCCPANINRIDGVTFQDLFDYLQLYFAGDPGAEFDGVPGISVNDLFAFLQVYFLGC